MAQAESGPDECSGECSELEPSMYRVRFALVMDAAVYIGLTRLLEVRHWRAEVCEDDEPVSVHNLRRSPSRLTRVSSRDPFGGVCPGSAR